MALTHNKPIRPLLLTFICIACYAWALINFLFVFGPAVKRLGDWMPAILGIIIAANFISVVGIWYMKRWGVNWYIISVFAKQLFFYLNKDLNMAGVFFSLLFTICFLIFYKRMDENL